MLLLCKKMKAQELKERISCLLFEEFLALEVIHMKFGFSSKVFFKQNHLCGALLVLPSPQICTLLLLCSFSIT